MRAITIAALVLAVSGGRSWMTGRPLQLPESSLAVLRGDRWTTFWRSDSAPARWTNANAVVRRSVQWSTVAPGLRRGMLRVAGTGEAWRLNVVLLEIDSHRFMLRPTSRIDGDRRWTIDSASSRALAAFNGGQFHNRTPWGWLVRDGHEEGAPGRGPLAPALVVNGAHDARIVGAGDIAVVRAANDLETALQSYPGLLLDNGDVPRPLREDGLGVDLIHRDARLALGITRDGHVLVALTRFGALGTALSRLPFGPTTPEMAAIMGALGCSQAMLLDGGISAQLMIRRGRTIESWSGVRTVPIGIEVIPRS